MYSNRAACYTKLAAFYEAEKDAKTCIKMDPTFVKGYSRLGHVEFFTKQYDKVRGVRGGGGALVCRTRTRWSIAGHHHTNLN